MLKVFRRLKSPEVVFVSNEIRSEILMGNRREGMQWNWINI